jgi:hypothetical protein
MLAAMIFFLAKYDPNGNLLWAKSFGGDRFDDSHGIVIGSDDRIYLTGTFGSTNINFGSISFSFSSYHLYSVIPYGAKVHMAVHFH